MTTRQTRSSDERLVLRAQTGDAAAFEELVRAYFDMVYSIGYVRTKHRQTAEDLAQEVFLRVFLHLDTLRDPARFPAWVGQMTRNLAYHWSRKQRRATSLVAMTSLDVDAVGIPDNRMKEARQTMENQERIGAIRDALFQLPAEQAETVVLRFGEGIKPPEIARRLDVHPTTVRRRLKRALEAMKKTLPGALTDTVPALLPDGDAALRTLRTIDAVAVLSREDRAALTSLSAGGSEKGVWGTGMPLRSFFYWGYQTTPGRVIMPDAVAERRYDITLETLESQFDALYPAMQKLLAKDNGTHRQVGDAHPGRLDPNRLQKDCRGTPEAGAAPERLAEFHEAGQHPGIRMP